MIVQSGFISSPAGLFILKIPVGAVMCFIDMVIWEIPVQRQKKIMFSE